MARNNVLQWRDGRGWLVLSGKAIEGSAVRAQAIGRMAADGGIAYLSLASSSDVAEAALADFEDLGASSGYLVDVLSEDDDTIRAQLADAGMIVINAATDATSVRSVLLGAAAEGMQAAFENGALILAEGVCAAALGEWILVDNKNVIDGLGWLAQSVILPEVVAVAGSVPGRAALEYSPSALAIGIGPASALVLGPDGEVEIWGDKQVTVALGRMFTSSNEQ